MASSASYGLIYTFEDVGLQQIQFTDITLGGPGTIPILDTVSGTHGEDIIAGLANTMLATLTTGLPFDRYTAVSNGPGIKNVQDFVVVGPIPLPGAFLLGMLGVGTMRLMRRTFA